MKSSDLDLLLLLICVFDVHSPFCIPRSLSYSCEVKKSFENGRFFRCFDGVLSVLSMCVEIFSSGVYAYSVVEEEGEESKV